MAKRIGELLVEGGVLSQSQLEQALFAQRKDGRKLGLLLMELGLVSETQLTQTLSRQLSVPWVSLYHVDFSRSLLNLLSREIAERYCVVPVLVRRVRKQGDTLYIAMDDPTNEGAIEEIARAVSLAVKPMIACPSDIRAAIRVYYLGETAPAVAAVPSAPQAIGPRAVPNGPSKKPPSLRPAKAREPPPRAACRRGRARRRYGRLDGHRRTDSLVSSSEAEDDFAHSPRRDEHFDSGADAKAFQARRRSCPGGRVQRSAHGSRPRQRVARCRPRSRSR